MQGASFWKRRVTGGVNGRASAPAGSWGTTFVSGTGPAKALPPKYSSTRARIFSKIIAANDVPPASDSARRRNECVK